MKVMANKSYVMFDNMTWPRVGQSLEDLNWKLRYADEHLSREDLLFAASIISAYKAIVYKKNRTRNNIIRNLVSLETPAPKSEKDAG